jgi:hypothetical protein
MKKDSLKSITVRDYNLKLYIIHKGKRIFIHSLAQLKEIQDNTLFKKLKRSVLIMLFGKSD